MIRSAIIAAALTVAGCNVPGMTPLAPEADPANPSAVSAATTIERDEYQQMTRIVGPLIVGWFDDRNYSQYRVRMWAGNEEHPLHGSGQVYGLATFYGEWGFIDRAYAKGGRELDFVLIDRQVDNCRYGCLLEETFGINLTRDELRDAARTGLDFKVMGRRGEREYSIPATYFQGVLTAAARTN